jgi:DNA-binding IclR family transcriptional regulator
MERVAADLSARCIATAPAEDHLVVVASAGGANATARATLVGQRLPLMPPAGAVFAAWRDDDGIDDWLQAIDSTQARAEQRDRLAAVRRRGCSLGLKSELFASTLDRLAEDPDAVDHEDLRGLVRDLSYDPIALTPELSRDIRVITAPVFGPDGIVRLALTIYGFPDPAARGGIEAYVERLGEASETATKILGGNASASA